jgi:hypothetical protein
MKQRHLHILKQLHEQIEPGYSAPWTVRLSIKRTSRALIASADCPEQRAGRPISPIRLSTGRDFLNAIRAIVFELTNRAMTPAEPKKWIESLALVDSMFASRALRALRSEIAYSAEELGYLGWGAIRNCQPAYLPVIYRNRRVEIVDVRALGLEERTWQLLMVDRRIDLEIGYAEWTRESVFFGSVNYGPHSLECGGYTLAELASSALAQHEWTMRN